MISGVLGLAVLTAAGASTAVTVPALARQFPSRQVSDRTRLATWSPTTRCCLAAVGIVAFVGTGRAVETPVAWCAIIAVGSLLLTSAAVDLRTHRLPDRLTRATAVTAVVTCVVVSAVDSPWAGVAAIVGALCFFVIIEGVRLVQPAGMGLGDVKLAIVLGFTLGVVALRPGRAMVLVLTALFLALVLSLIGSAVAGLVTSRRLPRHVPFGPGLIVGSWTVATLAIAGVL